LIQIKRVLLIEAEMTEIIIQAIFNEEKPYLKFNLYSFSSFFKHF
jgi:hypothetical protein